MIWNKTLTEIIINYYKFKKPQSGLITIGIIRVHMFFN